MKNLFFRDPIITNEETAHAYTRSVILSDLLTINGDNSTIEVRMPKTAKSTVVGYFNDMEMLCDAIMPYNGKNNIFVTLNPCPNDLAATMNQLQPYAKNSTKDAEIIKRRWLLIDVDPKKPSSDMSSTSEEQGYALSVATEIEAYLSANGFSSPIIANSGNGVHCLYRVEIDNDDVSKELCKAFLNSLSDKFSNERVEVDRGVFNAARICKLYGTIATKGEDSAERPHRRSSIMDAPENVEIVTAEQIKAVIALLTPPQLQPAAHVKSHSADVGFIGKAFDVEGFIKTHNLDLQEIKDDNEKRLYRIACPFKEHEDKRAYIIQSNNGAIGAGCPHNSCGDWKWQDLRAKFDPVYSQKQELRREAAETQLPEHLAPYNALLTAEKDTMRIDAGGNILILTGGKTPYWAKLTNFVPIPLEILTEIDGIEDDVKQMSVRLGGILEGVKEMKSITIDIERLQRGKWFMNLDFKASVNPDVYGGHEKLREVIQILSPTADHITTYSHLGFRRIEGKPCFLHSGGAIGIDPV